MMNEIKFLKKILKRVKGKNTGAAGKIISL